MRSMTFHDNEHVRDCLTMAIPDASRTLLGTKEGPRAKRAVAISVVPHIPSKDLIDFFCLKNGDAPWL